MTFRQAAPIMRAIAPGSRRSLSWLTNTDLVPELQALGHTVRLMPPAYVKPYVKRQKNDTTDAEAICEAVTRPNMRFVPTKTPAQQSCLMLHRARHLFIRQQTAVINSIRAYFAEFGIVAPVGRRDARCRLPGVEPTFDRCAGMSPFDPEQTSVSHSLAE